MITIIGRRLIIPDCDRILGVVGDKNTPVKIKLSENTLESYLPGAKSFGDVAIILKLEHETATVTVPPILCVHDKDGVYVGDLSILSSVNSGLVSAQAMIVLPGSATDDTALDDAESIWQSDEDYFYIADDIELKSFSNSSDTYTNFQNLLAAVGNKVIAAESAKNAAETAKDAAETAESNAEGAEERINKTVTSFNEAYGDFSLQAEKAKEHYDSRSNPHEVTAEQVGAYSKYEVDLKVGSVAMLADNVDSRFNNHEKNHQNPHKVTAEQVGAYPKDKLYTKEEVDELVNNVDVDLSEYVKNTDYASADKGGVIKIRNNTYGLQIGADNGIVFIKKATNEDIDGKVQEYRPIVPANLEYAVKSVGDGYYAKEDAVFETSSFGWTDFGNYLSGVNGFIGTVYYDRIIIDKAVDNEFVIIECDGNTLGFSFSISGYSDAILRINGEVKRYINSTKDGSVFATDTIPLTAVTGGIYFVGNNNTWTFTDMKRQSVQGVSELESQIGDIDTALDSILDIQNGLIGGDA